MVPSESSPPIVDALLIDLDQASYGVYQDQRGKLIQVKNLLPPIANLASSSQ